MKMLAVIGLSLATAVTGVAPAAAFPSFQGPHPQVSDSVQQVKQRKWYRKHGRNRGFSSRYVNRGDNDGGSFRRYYWRGGDGHRYRSHRYKRYYRDYDDDFDNFGAVFGGLAAGAVIGGLLSQPYYNGPNYWYGSPTYYAPNYYGSNSHVGWCYARYRSYRAYDNTFQPYYGPRRQCISPYR